MTRVRALQGGFIGIACLALLSAGCGGAQLFGDRPIRGAPRRMEVRLRQGTPAGLSREAQRTLVEAIRSRFVERGIWITETSDSCEATLVGEVLAYQPPMTIRVGIETRF